MVSIMMRKKLRGFNIDLCFPSTKKNLMRVGFFFNVKNKKSLM